MLSVCHLNVHGNLEKKLQCNNFIDKFKHRDIIIFSECWTHDNSVIEIPGYKKIVKHRPKVKRAKRCSGGVCMFYKESISRGILELNWDQFEDGILARLDKVFFGFEEHVYLLCPYIKPSTSSRNPINTDISPFEFVIDKVAELSPQGQIIIIGDLNSRCSDLTDIHLYDQDDVDYEVNEHDLTYTDFVNNNMSIKRTNQDKCVNENGRMLMRLCNMSSLLPLNGRFGKDKDIGNNTYCERRKNKLYKSTVDYVLCTKRLIYGLVDFEIEPPNIFSDHAQINVVIHCNILTIPTNDPVNACQNDQFKVNWRVDEKEQFVDTLCNPESEQYLNEIINFLNEAPTIDEHDIDECMNKFCNVIKNAGNPHVSKSTSKTSTARDRSNSWFDEELKNMKIMFDLHEKAYRVTHNDEDRLIMCKTRNQYRKLCRIKRKQTEINKASELFLLSKSNPKQFWKSFKRRTNKSGNCDFNKYFKELYDLTPEVNVNEGEISYVCNGTTQCNTDIMLDSSITADELSKAINALKNNKACGMDGIINEFMKNSTSLVKDTMLKLFNTILDSGIFPSQWAIGEIVPVFKKGDINDPNCYRGITLISCLAKLFTMIINKRLNLWAEVNAVLTEVQFGFRKDKSTTDCLFILHGLIEHSLGKSETLYCSFVDLTRAFDGLDRKVLWYKLHENGISCKVINLIKDMYSKIKLRVKSPFNASRSSSNDGNINHDNDVETDQISDFFFTSNAGVFQGESLSPFLFSMYVNDLSNYLDNVNEVGIDIDQMVLTALMFADDMAVFSKSRKGLQNGLNALHEYCLKWGLKVNTSKTKCVAFKNGGRIGLLDSWSYDGSNLETVNQFKYLGFDFGSSGKFAKGLKGVLDKSYKALFSLKSIIYQYPELTVNNQLLLFNSLVEPVLSYGSEVWGFSQADKLETLYLRYLKNMLCVRSSTPSCFVYKESNVFPLIVNRYVRIFKYWLKIISLPNSSLVKRVYNLLVNDMLTADDDITNWVTLLKSMLEKHGMGFIWHQQQYLNNTNSFIISFFKKRINDIYSQNINASISLVSNTRLYKHLNAYSVNNAYLFTIQDKYIRRAITKFRLGSHNLMIERGRWLNLEVVDRQCMVCNKIEDEYHVIVECTLYVEWRKKYVPKSLTKNPSMFKFIKLLNNLKDNELRLFGLFCNKILDYYSKYII